MLKGLHFLLTYACNFACDHCFLYCGPDAQGTFTIDQVRRVLEEAAKIGSVEMVYFEGGEPFLYYPLMLEGIRIARGMGFETGVVTNCYWASSVEDAVLWLSSLSELGVSDVSVSDDAYHHGHVEVSPAQLALAAAEKLGMPASSICIEEPRVETSKTQERGAPVVGGGVMFKGRAVEKLTAGLPRGSWAAFTECPYEDLRNPSRVHVDPYGYVHLCQGLSMGNMWATSLSALVASYDPDAHPICGPLLHGGPAALVRAYNVEHEDAYVSACHLCYAARRALINRFPEYLAPRQVYGLK